MELCTHIVQKLYFLHIFTDLFRKDFLTCQNKLQFTLMSEDNFLQSTSESKHSNKLLLNFDCIIIIDFTDNL